MDIFVFPERFQGQTVKEMKLQVLEATQTGIWTLQTFLQQEDTVLCPYMVPLFYALLSKMKRGTLKKDEQGEKKQSASVTQISDIQQDKRDDGHRYFEVWHDLPTDGYQQSPYDWRKRARISAGLPFNGAEKERQSRDLSQ